MNSRAKLWWVVLLQGIAAIILGLFVLFKPVAALFLFILVLGVYMVINGLVDILFGLIGSNVHNRFGVFLMGWLSFFIGTLVVMMPFFTSGFFASWFFYTVAAGMLVIGFIRIFLKPKDGSSRRFTDIALGILFLLLGLLMFVAPQTSLNILVTLLAVWVVVTGMFTIFNAFELRTLSDPVL
jgi:uncharacterized membrane protein HdeD (DUF308 family)